MSFLDDEDELQKRKARKRHRLSDIQVYTVGLVDTPAVQGSQFLIAKRHGAESEYSSKMTDLRARVAQRLSDREVRALHCQQVQEAAYLAKLQ